MGRSFHNCRLPTKIEEIIVNERGEIKKMFTKSLLDFTSVSKEAWRLSNWRL